MYSHTTVVLEKFDNQHDFERMCADILIALGYRDVVLIAPRGGSDGGKDITFTTETGGKGLACVTLRNDIEKKFTEDFSQRQAGEYEKYFFFCTSYLTARQKLTFTAYCLNTLHAEIVPQDVEALRGLLDSAFPSIRAQYLGIKDERLPDLQFGFSDNGQVVAQITCPVKDSWSWQPIDVYVENELRWKREELAQMLTRGGASVPEVEIQRWRKEYEEYLAQLAPALKMQFVKDYMPSCKLQLLLRNEGTAPAHGVDVRVTFPSGASIIKIDSVEDEVDIDEKLPDEPSIPAWARPPVPGWMQAIVAPSVVAQALNALSVYPNKFPYPYPFTTITTKTTYDSANFPFGKNILHRKNEKLTHHREWFFDPIAVYFPPSTREGVTIAYEIVSDELPDPITGEIKIVWD